MKAKIREIRTKIKERINNFTFRSTPEKLKKFFNVNTRPDLIKTKIGHLKVKMFYGCVAKEPRLKEFFENCGDLTISELIDKDQNYETFFWITRIATKK